jgi:hypothetical protein
LRVRDTYGKTLREEVSCYFVGHTLGRAQGEITSPGAEALDDSVEVGKPSLLYRRLAEHLPDQSLVFTQQFAELRQR